VTWDGSKRGSYREQKEEKKKRQRVNFDRRIGRVGGICGRKP
jgi:hypothetical protein